MTNICKLAVLLLLVSPPLFAFPDEEKAALDLVSSKATSMILEDDRYLYLSFGDDIFRVDTETWALTTDQVPALTDNTEEGGDDLTGDISGLAVQDDSLFAAQTDGDLLTIVLDDLTETPETTEILSGILGPMAADPEGGDGNDKLYLLDKTNNAVIVTDVSDGSKSSIPLTNSLGSAVIPVAIVFVPFPTDTSTSTTDKIYVTSDSGLVFVLNEGGTDVSSRISLSSENKALPSAAATPGGDFLLVVNATDTSVHVIATLTDTEVDTDGSTGGTNPVSLADNASLEGIAVTDVSDPDDVYAYVTGSRGVSVIDLNISATGFAAPEVLDFNDEGVTDTVEDPLVLSSIAGPILPSTDGSLYTSNSDASLSVISDNPFVIISSTSLGSSALTSGGSFTVTFQSDETGSYTILVGGGLTGTGTQVASGTVDAADTDTTTAGISYDAGIFQEGTNRVFIFVTDGEGNEGRDAVDITVDTPPGAIEIESTGFGNEKVYLTFGRLTASDMDHYNFFIEADDDTDGDCDEEGIGTKTEAAGTLPQTDSGSTIEAKITGLVNGQPYCLGVEGVDAAGNIGPRTTTLSDGSAATATPERTIGLAEAVGETGCSLIRLAPAEGGRSAAGLVWVVFAWVLLRGLKKRRSPHLILAILLLLPAEASAKELTPQWWSLEIKGGAWMPLDGTAKDFLGSCCEPGGGAEFGFLYRSKFGFEVGVGYVGAGGSAVGAASGAVSRDDFGLTLIPIQNSFTFRADFKEDQLLVPYAKTGLDYMIFRENVQGTVTRGLKMGVHVAGGLQILMDKLEDLSDSFERAMGVNDVYFTVEGRYAWVNGFGGSGMDLSNLTFSGGFLFEF